MPRINTECTEVSLAFGLMERDPTTVDETELLDLFEGSFPTNKWPPYLAEYQRDLPKYRGFVEVGERLRSSHPYLTDVTAVRWAGPEQQAATASVARDLEAKNIPISVKDDSNVTHNYSPHNLFVSIPEGRTAATREQNWFIRCDPEGMQVLYTQVRDSAGLKFAKGVRDFEDTASRSYRRTLQHAIRGLGDTHKMQFDRLYVQMCRNVARISAEQFNSALADSLATGGRQSVLENIVKGFFRVNSVSYVLAGFDEGQPFAVRIPDITEFKQRWRVNKVQAVPDLARRQSVVELTVSIGEKTKGAQSADLDFRVEIRWSHGKFCGNPEAKLYKSFKWREVPFFQVYF